MRWNGTLKKECLFVGPAGKFAKSGGYGLRINLGLLLCTICCVLAWMCLNFGAKRWTGGAPIGSFPEVNHAALFITLIRMAGVTVAKTKLWFMREILA